MREPREGAGTGLDWVISLEPVGGSGTWLEILPEGVDEVEAVACLEAWADTFDRRGFVPLSGGWENGSPIAVTGRAGLMVFRVRCDSFESSEGTGGAGFLRLRGRPR